MKLIKSKKILKLSNLLLPGGSTFNKTNFFDNGKTPFCLKSGKGSKVKDLDNNSYIDFMNGLGCNLLGYSVPFINKAISKWLEHNKTGFFLINKQKKPLSENSLTKLLNKTFESTGKSISIGTSTKTISHY